MGKFSRFEIFFSGILSLWPIILGAQTPAPPAGVGQGITEAASDIGNFFRPVLSQPLAPKKNSAASQTQVIPQLRDELRSRIEKFLKKAVGNNLDDQVDVLERKKRERVERARNQEITRWEEIFAGENEAVSHQFYFDFQNVLHYGLVRRQKTLTPEEQEPLGPRKFIPLYRRGWIEARGVTYCWPTPNVAIGDHRQVFDRPIGGKPIGALIPGQLLHLIGRANDSLWIAY